MNESKPATPTEPKPSPEPAFGGCCVLGFTASILILGLLILFVVNKGTNYTSFSPWNLSIIFFPTAVVGFRSIHRSGPRLPAVFACVAGLAGMSYLYYLYHTGRMISYMEMIWRSKNGL